MVVVRHLLRKLNAVILVVAFLAFEFIINFCDWLERRAVVVHYMVDFPRLGNFIHQLVYASILDRSGVLALGPVLRVYRSGFRPFFAFNLFLPVLAEHGLQRLVVVAVLVGLAAHELKDIRVGVGFVQVASFGEHRLQLVVSPSFKPISIVLCFLVVVHLNSNFIIIF